MVYRDRVSVCSEIESAYVCECRESVWRDRVCEDVKSVCVCREKEIASV